MSDASHERAVQRRDIVGNGIKTRHIVQIDNVSRALENGEPQNLGRYTALTYIKTGPDGQQGRRRGTDQHAEIRPA